MGEPQDWVSGAMVMVLSLQMARTCAHRILELFSATSLPPASCRFSHVTTYRGSLGSGRTAFFFYFFTVCLFIYLAAPGP